MSTEVITPPFRENTDWYRVKYQLASTYLNRAYVEGTSFKPAVTETNELLAVIWRVLAADWGRRRMRRAPLLSFLRQPVEPATLSLKAIADLGLHGFEPGEPQGLDLSSVRKTLQAGGAVSPRTIIDAVLTENRECGPALCFDFACFFVLTGDRERARKHAEEGLRKVPPGRRARVRDRLAADPMLKAIPGLETMLEPPPKASRCGLFKREPKPIAPPRPWV